MKKAALMGLILCLLPWAGLSEAVGFGFVKKDKVNVRVKPGGKIILRLDEGHEVYVSDTQTDKTGQTWYHINTYLHYNYGHYEKKGWVRGDLIEAGDEYWKDIVDIAAEDTSLIALQKNGSVLGVSTPSYAGDENLKQ